MNLCWITFFSQAVCEIFAFSGVLNNMQQPSPLVSSGASGYSTASGRGYAEVTMIPVATAGPCYKECDMILPFMVLLFFMTLLVAVTQMPVLMVVLRSGKIYN